MILQVILYDLHKVRESGLNGSDWYEVEEDIWPMEFTLSIWPKSDKLKCPAMVIPIHWVRLYIGITEQGQSFTCIPEQLPKILN